MASRADGCRVAEVLDLKSCTWSIVLLVILTRRSGPAAYDMVTSDYSFPAWAVCVRRKVSAGKVEEFNDELLSEWLKLTREAVERDGSFMNMRDRSYHLSISIFRHIMPIQCAARYFPSHNITGISNERLY